MKLKIPKKYLKIKRIKFFLLAFLFCNSFSICGQNIDVQMIVLDLNDNITFDDLWNINIVSNESGTYNNFFIQLRGFEQQSGQLFTAKTKSFTVTPGLTSFNSTNYYSLLQPVINFTSYNNSSSLIQSGGHFPSGNYSFIYDLYGIVNNPGGSQTTEFIATFSLNKTLGLFFPPMLLEPENEFVFNYEETNTVIFCWTPAFASNISNPITYNISVYQMYDGQTPEQAVQSNPTFINESNLPGTCYTYPMSAQFFNDNTTYAWEVKAFNGNSILGETELWSFRFETPKRKSPVHIDSNKTKPIYYLMQEQLNSSYAEDLTLDSLGNKSNVLRFVFKEHYNIEDSLNLKYAIYSDSTNMLIQNIPNKKVKYHDNFYEINFNTLEIPYGYYILEVIDSRNDKWFLRFLFEEGENNN